jgi:signal transduction histidine kinase
MRKAAFFAAIVSAPLLFVAGAASAQQQQFGTAAEAKAMLAKAVAAVKADEKAALEKFKKGEGGFKDRDLYVFCFDAMSGKLSAHPNAKLIGTDVRTLKDKKGEPFGEKIYQAAKADAVTAVDYVFPKPGGTEPVPKESFVTKIKDQGCAVGYYK